MAERFLPGSANSQPGALSHEQLTAILGGVPHGIVGIDLTGHILFANQAAANLHGYSGPDEMNGLAAEPLLAALRLTDEAGEPLPWETLPLQRALDTWQAQQRLVRLPPGAASSERWIILKAQPIPGTPPGTQMVLLVLQDVTALKLAEQERDAWMQTLAHDLKTPLTAIRGYAQLAVRNIAARDRQGALTDLERVVKASDRLTKMVEQLGDLTRIQTQGGLQLRVRPCNMVELVQRAVELAQASTTLHRLRLELLVDSLIIPADAERLERVFENLLSNAIKYSPEGGDIDVRAGQNEPGLAYASITDAGIGISQEDMARIFVRFGRGRNVGKIDGSGIGLSFCQAVVHAHGGQIHLESQPAKGTRVTVRFPLLEPASVGDAMSDGAPWERFHLPLTSD